jgi:hypothetical protein
LSGKELPNKQLVKDLDTKWKPIFRKMAEAPGFQYPQDAVEETFVRSSFDLCIVHLKSVVGYVWAKARNEKVVDGYTIGTWSRKVARSEIEKHGTPQDIANLPDATRRNQADRVQRGEWTNNKRGVRRVATQKRKRPRTVREREEADALLVADGLLEALADEHMDLAMQLM